MKKILPRHTTVNTVVPCLCRCIRGRFIRWWNVNKHHKTTKSGLTAENWRFKMDELPEKFDWMNADERGRVNPAIVGLSRFNHVGFSRVRFSAVA